MNSPRFRWQVLCRLRVVFACMPLMEPRWTEQTQRRVESEFVVEGLNMFEEGRRRLLVAVIGAGVHTLGLDDAYK